MRDIMMANSPTISDGGETAVKERCWDQREALAGEPICVICGRYGEYICDETDDDVCSLECKQTLLSKLPKYQKPKILLPSVRIPVIDECFYVKEGGDESRSQRLTSNQIALLRDKGDSLPPAFSFCNLPEKLQQNLEAAGYEVPTPVQMKAIPAALNRKNLLVSADTGSGKTASFLVPIVSQCVAFGSKAMVLAPTRELCVQVEEHAKVFGKGLPFKTALVVGGDAMAGQIYRIRQGVELIVGTPGRLIDLFTKHDVDLDQVSILVLDEVDCMLQIGFRDQVIQIFQALSHPQILMYSATISPEVEKMATSMAKDLTFISVGKPNTPIESVKQVVIWVEPNRKKQKLFEILSSKQHFKPPVVVFVGSRVGADLLSDAITVTTGIKALSIHGEKPMKERREVLRQFLKGEVCVIVATGVLGRGIDLLTVRQVIVFDMPNSIEEYIHQVGRASRLGEEGIAIALVNEENNNLFGELVQIIKSSGAVVPRELSSSRYTMACVSSAKRPKKRKYNF